MTVERIEHQEKKIWYDFVLHQEKGNIFHHPAWMDLISKTYGYHPFYLTEIESGRVTGGLPFLEIDSKITGKRWISLPFTDYYDPLTDMNTTSELIAYLENLNDKRQAPDIEIRWNLPGTSTYKVQTDVLHLLPLGSSYDDMEARFKKSHTRNIKTAQRNNVKIEFGNQLSHVKKYYHLHALTRKRQGVPVQPWKFFENLHQSIIEKNLGFVILAYYQGECIAGAIFLYWKNTLTYKYGASLKKYLNLRPNNLIFSEAIRWGCDHGYSILDMGKTDLQNIGLRNFKSYWGAEEIPLVYTHVCQRPPKTGHSDIVETVMKKVIQNSPVFITRWIGELIYGDFA